MSKYILILDYDLSFRSVTFEKEIFQRGDLHVLLAQQSNKDLGTNWSYWGACRGSGALKTLACVAGI